MNKISVIIPSYKPDYYIWECLDSVKNQILDKEKYEVLIILNGQKYPYYNEILDYINKNSLFNFKLFYTEKKGVSNARNIGLKRAKGNYIAFLDDDDFFSLEYLKNFYLILNKGTIFVARLKVFEGKNFNNKLKEYKYKENDKEKQLLKYRREFSYIGGKIIPQDIIKNFKFNLNYKNGEDSLFMIEISKNIKYIQTSLNNTIYWRRIRNNSAGHRKKEKKYIIKNNYLMLKEYIKLLKNKEYSKKLIFLKMLAIIKGTFIGLVK